MRQVGSLLLAMVVPASGPSSWQRFGLLPPLRGHSRHACSLPALVAGSAPSPDPRLTLEDQRQLPDAGGAGRPSPEARAASSPSSTLAPGAAAPQVPAAPDAPPPGVRFQHPHLWLPALTSSGSCKNLLGDQSACASPAGSPELRSPVNRPGSSARLVTSHSAHAVTLPRTPSVSPTSLPRTMAHGARSPVTRSSQAFSTLPSPTSATAAVTTTTTTNATGVPPSPSPSPSGRNAPSTLGQAGDSAMTPTSSAAADGGGGAAAPGGGGGRTTFGGAVASGASVDPREAAKFAALAASWWRTTDGPFAPLHALNPARVKFIRQSLATALGLDAEAPEPLAGLRVLDVGCGGGILSESLARLGAEVHGIDVTRENVEVARVHAREDPRVAARVRYDVISAEDLAASCTNKYDIVVASEVLEHVSRPHQLLPVLASLMAQPPADAAGGTQPWTDADGHKAQPHEGCAGDDGPVQPPRGSALIVSTLNRTPAAWAVAIAGAEYVARVVPVGTHQWQRFITPEELAVMAGACGLKVWHAAGMAPAGPRLSWQLSRDLSVNYIATLLRWSQDSSNPQQDGSEPEQPRGGP